MDNACVIGNGVVGHATATLFGIKKNVQKRMASYPTRFTLFWRSGNHILYQGFRNGSVYPIFSSGLAAAITTNLGNYGSRDHSKREIK